MGPSSTLLLFALFYATEKVIGYAGGKIADVMSKPIWEALENKARWLAKNDDTSKRWQAFKHAFDQAKTHFVDAAPYPEMARRVRDVLETTDSKQVDGSLVEQLTAKLEKASLLTEKPNTEAMTTLCLAILAQRGGPAPARADVADALAYFIEVFQNQLFAQSAYREWMLQQAKWQKLHQRRTGTRAPYLAQFIDCHQSLDFVGIPELKDRQALHVEDVFINLKALLGEGREEG
jgi:hypothetical protein